VTQKGQKSYRAQKGNKEAYGLPSSVSQRQTVCYEGGILKGGLFCFNLLDPELFF